MSTVSQTPARALSAEAASTAAAKPLTAANLRTGLVHGNAPAIDFRVIEFVDSSLRRLLRLHFDEAEAASTPSRLVAHHAH